LAIKKGMEMDGSMIRMAHGKDNFLIAAAILRVSVAAKVQASAYCAAARPVNSLLCQRNRNSIVQ
jgi:hypothetical protein